MKRNLAILLVSMALAACAAVPALLPSAPPASTMPALIARLGGRDLAPSEIGNDAFIRRRPVAGQDGSTLTLRDIRLTESPSRRRGIQIAASSTDIAGVPTYARIEIIGADIGPLTLTQQRLAEQFHGDGIKIDGGDSRKVDVLIQDVRLHDLGTAITPLHLVDGRAFGAITLRRVSTDNCALPSIIGGKAKCDRLIIEDCDGLRIGKPDLLLSPLPALEVTRSNVSVWGTDYTRPATHPTICPTCGQLWR